MVALVSESGQPVQGGYYVMETGARTDAVRIRDGEIGVEALIAGQDGPAGTPRLPVTATFRLRTALDGSRQLELTSQSSETPTGDSREIGPAQRGDRRDRDHRAVRGQPGVRRVR